MRQGDQRKADRRQFGRLRTRFHAWALVAGRPRIACVVHNLSVNGALLEVTDSAALPGTFTLDIEVANVNSVCDVRHRNGRMMGVEFRAPVSLTGLTGFGPAA